MNINKYAQAIEIIKENYDHTTDITADLLETLVDKGIIDEDAIDTIVKDDDNLDDVVPDVLGIANTYSDFTYAFSQDLAENDIEQ